MGIHSIIRIRRSTNSEVNLYSTYHSSSEPEYVVDMLYQIVNGEYVDASAPGIIATRMVTTHAHHHATVLPDDREFTTEDVLKQTFPDTVTDARLYCDRQPTYGIYGPRGPNDSACYHYDLQIHQKPKSKSLDITTPECTIRVANTQKERPSSWDDVDWDTDTTLDRAHDKYC